MNGLQRKKNWLCETTSGGRTVNPLGYQATCPIVPRYSQITISPRVHIGVREPLGMFMADEIEPGGIVDSGAVQVLAADDGYAFRDECLNL